MTTTTNIAEFDNDLEIPSVKIVFFGNIALFFGLMGFLFVASLNIGYGNADHSTNLNFVLFFVGGDLASFVLFIGGMLLFCYLDKNAPERKRQAAARQASLNLLETQYGINIPYRAVDELRARYVRNSRNVDPLFLSRFDSVQDNGTPGSYALRMNANGVIEMFSTVGVEWVSVPSVGLTV